MHVTNDTVTRFREEGYVIDPAFFGEDEVTAMRLELERLMGAGQLRNVSTNGDGATHSAKRQNLQICPLTPHSRLFRSLGWANKVVDVVRALIGDPVVRQLDQCFWKPAQSGAPTNWHQDNAYFKLPEAVKGTGMWIAIHEATAANGTMRIIPGSHKQEYEHSRDPDSDHHIRAYPDEENAIHIELPPGGVLFFNYGVLHCTGRNETDHPRAGVAYHFLNADAVPSGAPKDHSGEPLPFVTGPKASDGVNEFGENIRNTWPGEVERVLGEHAAAT
jgi:ectoine hydroxylase-related dioxygenase (phytanoyl-CoA dioxygenase family)